MTAIVLMLCNTTTGRRTATRIMSPVSTINIHSSLECVPAKQFCTYLMGLPVKWTVALSKLKARMVTGSGILIFSMLLAFTVS